MFLTSKKTETSFSDNTPEKKIQKKGAKKISAW